ncbi:MAG: EAL domain-containing protein [Methylobacteriaceae bacterium]|nr:EAL domain-containing protein [Methylobacteriaceae bacterium]
MAKGRGLNSIANRFALLSAVLTGLLVAGHAALWTRSEGPDSAGAMLALSLGAIALPTAVTWLAARKLTAQIVALRKSTEALVAGDFQTPVEVDCACEVGGLADSFRKMVGRLNSNIVRMNVLAYTDPVTGLPNRAVLTHMLGHFTSAAQPGQGAVVFIDLDGFKKVNDTLGHAAGDAVLKSVSLRIVAGLGRRPDQIDTCTTPFGELCNRPPEDVVLVRFAGDEFVALLPGVVDEAELERLGAAIVREIGGPIDIDDNEVRIGASVGVARAPLDSADPKELLTFADLAMYAAKESGKNRTVLFDARLRDVAVEQSRLESDLREAIATEALTVEFQPRLCARTLDCAGFEALARWRHPVRGQIAPSRFVPVAEQAGLMPAIGARVLDLAIAQCRRWIDEGRDWRVSVNVSPLQFESPDFVAGVLALLKKHDVPASMIELEITESLIMSDFPAVSARMRQLQDVGLQISIDDFGIGFSNLSQLARLRFNMLKIDRSLAADIGVNQRSESIIKAIIDMAHALGHGAVAEGIETAEQYAFLASIGCDSVQGFLFGRPMSVAAIEGWLTERNRIGARALQAELSSRIAAAG